MLFYSSASTQVLFQTQAVSMLVALWFKVRNGQQPNGYMLTILIRPLDWGVIALMRTIVVNAGLLLENAPRTLSIWSEVMTFLVPVEGVVRFVNYKFCFTLSTSRLYCISDFLLLWGGSSSVYGGYFFVACIFICVKVVPNSWFSLLFIHVKQIPIQKRIMFTQSKLTF